MFSPALRLSVSSPEATIVSSSPIFIVLNVSAVLVPPPVAEIVFVVSSIVMLVPAISLFCLFVFNISISALIVVSS